MKSVRTFAVVWLFCSFAALLGAQGLQTGTIRGVIRDQQGLAVLIVGGAEFAGLVRERLGDRRLGRGGRRGGGDLLVLLDGVHRLGEHDLGPGEVRDAIGARQNGEEENEQRRQETRFHDTGVGCVRVRGEPRG